MAQNFSFDIVSDVNFMEVENAVNQAQKELAQRFDFKGSKSTIDSNKEEKKLTLVGDDDFKLRALRDIVDGRLAKRGVSLKALEEKPTEKAFEGTVRQVINIVSGLPSEKAKEVVKIIKDAKLKVQAQMQDEKVRVTGKNRDDLQSAIALLREKQTNLQVPMQFENFRD